MLLAETDRRASASCLLRCFSPYTHVRKNDTIIDIFDSALDTDSGRRRFVYLSRCCDKVIRAAATMRECHTGKNELQVVTSGSLFVLYLIETGMRDMVKSNGLKWRK